MAAIVALLDQAVKRGRSCPGDRRSPRSRRAGSTSSATTPTPPAGSCCRWRSTSARRSSGEPRRRPGGAALRRRAGACDRRARRLAAARRARLGRPTSPASWPRSRPARGCAATSPRRCRWAPASRRAPRSSWRVALALGADAGPPSARPARPAGRAAGVRRALRDHGPAHLGRGGRRATRCSSTATTSRSSRCRCPTTSRWSWCTRACPARSPAPPTPTRRRGVRGGRGDDRPAATGPPGDERSIDRRRAAPPGPPRR